MVCVTQLSVRRLCAALLLFLGMPPAFAEIDLSGTWLVMYHEDGIEFNEGPDIADYTGLPINEAARRRALGWSPSLLNVPERQCMKLPIEYAERWSNLRVWKETDFSSQQLIAYHFRKEWGATERTIYMDQRPRPSTIAAHSFHGFSTGEWDGDKLKITTTHLKEGYIRTNGVPRSSQAIVTEHYIRHGSHLSISLVVQDPVFLTEPVIFSANFVLSLNRNLGPYPCESVTELASMSKGYVPHYFPWKNPFIKDFSTKYHIPFEVALGGADQIYPSFIE